MIRPIRVLFGSLLISMGVTLPIQGQAPYLWSRTNQVLGSRSLVAVTGQGVPANDDSGRITTTSDELFNGAEAEIEEDAFAGGGGDGGDSGFELFVDDGEDGWDGSPANGTPINGVSGQPEDQFAGAGGQAGEMGFAWTKGTTVCIDALNPNLQEVLEYSWLHNQ